MKVDISGLNKAQLLVALYNNAKKSAWTIKTIENMICPDQEVLEMLRDKFQSMIDDRIAQLNLTEDDANQLLAKRKYIDYIGPVLIKMNFSFGEVDPSAYDEVHGRLKGNTSELAENVIARLKADNSSMHWQYAGTRAAVGIPASGHSQQNASSASKSKL